MANLTYSSALQDRIAYTLLGAAYSTLTATQKAAIDGNSAADPPTAGRAKDAYNTIIRVGQWWELTAGTAVSDAAETWFVAEVVFWVALNVRPERIAEFKAAREQAMNDYLDAVTTTAITTGYSADPFSLSLQNIRYYVLRRVANVNRKALLSLVPEEIDAITFDRLTWFWNLRFWAFRRRHVTITIPVTSNGASPTINFVAGETFGCLATRLLYFVDSVTPIACRLATADQMAALKSNSSASTGRPEWFRIERSNNTYSWIWHPYPDQQYTAKLEVMIALPGTTTPGVPTSATDTVPFAKMPTEFIPCFKKLILGDVMQSRGLGDDVLRSATDEFERATQQYDDVHGDADLDGSPRDVYMDHANLPNANIVIGWGMTDVGGMM